jgi:Rieske Fe-S protein
VQDRRGILKTLTGLLGTIVSAMVAIPALRFLWHPVSHKMTSNGEEPLRVANLDELRPGQPVRVTVIGGRSDAWLRLENQKLGACWLVREGDQVRAFSTVCPHLGCGIDWNDATRKFDCPCHGSVFDLSGKCVAGPSPRAMDELEVTTKEKQIAVRYQRFRVSTAKKEPLG